MESLPKLSSIFEGVEFIVQDEAQSIRAIATRELLEDVFGAQAYPASWIRAYCDNIQAIHFAVDMLYRNSEQCSHRATIVLSSRLWNELSAASIPVHHPASLRQSG